MKKYKIAIDISPTIDGNAIRGVGYYTKNLITALKKINHPQFQVDFIEDSRKKIEDYDLIHYPYFDPFKLTLPSRKDIPVVVTVHDLIPRQFKPHFPVGLKGEIKWLIQKHRLEKTDHIITVSQYSKQIIPQIINYPLNQISITLEAANKNYQPIKDKKFLSTVKKKYLLPNKFVLYVGDINWNKNIPTLVKTCHKLKIDLVIAGSSATKKVISHPWTKDIIWLQSFKSRYLHLVGFIPDEDITAIYNLATIYCQPSYAEGFGLPVIEAMKSGCPVITSQESSLAEISGSAAVLFNPHSSKDLEDKIVKLWKSPKDRKKLSLAGIEQSKKFSWDKTARQTLQVYQTVLSHEK